MCKNAKSQINIVLSHIIGKGDVFMKKKIMSYMLSASMIFSVSAPFLAQPAAAQSISSEQTQESGKLLFPGDIVNFSSSAKVFYAGYNSETKELPVDGRLISLPDFGTVFAKTTLPGDLRFYCWKVDEDTVPESGKRSYIKLSAVFIKYDSEKADMSVAFSAISDKEPDIVLTPKTGYTLLSLGEGLSYNRETSAVTGTAFSAENLKSIDVLPLNDTYAAEKPTITVTDSESNPITSFKTCPKDVSQNITLSAQVKDSSGVLDVPVSWSIENDPDNVTINNAGVVTITPYFEDSTFNVVCVYGEVSAKVGVTLEHNFGEWRQTTAPTATTKGVDTRACTVCGATETRDSAEDKTPPTGTITIGGKSWTDFTDSAVSAEFVQKADVTITAADVSGVKDISYYISETPLTKEQAAAITSWIAGNTFSVTTDRKFIIYAKITDNASNVAYISSPEIIVDTVKPVITGIENGQTYYGEKTFTVTETNLSKVTVNDIEIQPVSGVYTISPSDSVTAYTVKAIDKAGNETTAVVNIYGNTVSAPNVIFGITENATYRKGSTLSFTATGVDMDKTTSTEGGIRYIPVSYTLDNTVHNFTSSSYTQTLSTGSMSIGTHTLSVLFKQQSYSAASGWQDTGKVNIQTITFKLEKREEIEKARASVKASFYTVKFDTNGGTKIDYVIVPRLKTLREPVAPTKVGYAFEGWYTDKALTDKYDFSERVSSNFTLYAKWTKTSSDNPFSDVSKDDWYYDNIAYVYATGLMNGTGDSSFSPEMPTTRAMIVTILYRLEGQPSISGTYFSDVVSGSYYSNAVSWAKEHNIVNGTSANLFSPEREITREQLMTILYRYAEYKDYDRSSMAALNGYTDADQISAYAADAFRWAVATKVASGRTSSFLSPKASATRAEVASAFKNFMEGNE